MHVPEQGVFDGVEFIVCRIFADHGFDIGLCHLHLHLKTFVQFEIQGSVCQFFSIGHRFGFQPFTFCIVVFFCHGVRGFEG